MSNVLEELRWRGFIAQVSGEEELGKLLAESKITCYCGFDPSASSLHVGNFLSIMLLAHFQRFGHTPIALVGGATGMIGDPSGKSQERNLIQEEQVLFNVSCIRKQLSRFLQFENVPNKAMLVNNRDWLGEFTFIDFLRDVGRYFRIGDMLAKDSVKSRMERESGVSYTEFSYMLMQSYDYLHLLGEYGCRLQLGGNDQWGNITSGIDFVRKLRSESVYGLTGPLLTDASGQKLGKTVSGAIWLDAQKTSPFTFYQYWVRADDADVIKFLKLFTFLSKDEIDELEALTLSQPEGRAAQKRLAWEITATVHGEEEAQKAVQASNVLYGEQIQNLSDAMLAEIFSDVPSTVFSRDLLAGGMKLLDLLVETKLASSKGAARKLVSQGGIYINNLREDGHERLIVEADLASESTIVLRSGKKNYHLAKFE